MYFDQINVLYGAIGADYCTLQACPTMNAPMNTQFYWLDEKGKKFKYSASQYIDTVLTYTAKTLSDESLFPTKLGVQFPLQFEQIIKKLNRHLFQIFVVLIFHKAIFCDISQNFELFETTKSNCYWPVWDQISFIIITKYHLFDYQ